MKKLIVIGAGDFARETIWVAERMNQQAPVWEILGFVDDRLAGQMVDGYPVLGNVEYLKGYAEDIWVTCAVGTGRVRKAIWTRIAENARIHPATLIDPSVIVGKNCEIGDGSIICAGTVLAIASKLGFSSIVNLNCTIGHDTVLEECCTVHPGSNISGRVSIGACTDIGTGSRIIQGKSIASGSILGAGAVVVRDIEEAGTYVGVPAHIVAAKNKRD